MKRKVYHVVYPEVPGYTDWNGKIGNIVNNDRFSVDDEWTMVEFESPVNFRNSVLAGLTKEWRCRTKLLFPTSEEAKIGRLNTNSMKFALDH